MIHAFSKMSHARSTPLRHALAASGVAIACSGAAVAQHSGDIRLDVVDGRLTTIGPIGESDDPRTVFAGEFGDTGIDAFTSNPGFDAFPGTFESGTRIGFDLLEPLALWNGDGFDALSHTVQERIRASFVTLSVESADGFVEGFELFVQPDGGWHRHLSWTLLGPDGTAPAPGVYLVTMQLRSDVPEIETSEPIHLVMNNEVDDETHLAAIEWALENLEPGADCPADFDGDGMVAGGDLAVLLGAWGTNSPDVDLDGDGTVSGSDLAVLLGAWGACP